MKEQMRQVPILSNCGLNCGLCPRYYTDGSSKCPGCGGENFNASRPTCGIISCSRRHGVEFCYECEEFPCKKYDNAENVDSFITHQNMMKNFAKVKEFGLDAYLAELREKMGLLEILLAEYNDGKRKSFYCNAVNLLELQDTRWVLEQVEAGVDSAAPVKEKAVLAVKLFEEAAERRGIVLKLRKKGKTEATV